MNKLYIITVTDGNIKPLKITMKSIDNQNFRNFKNIIISKKKINNSIKEYKNSQRLIFFRKNSSIYEAMNYGLKKSKNNSVMFLNSGDTFSSKTSLKKIFKQIKNNPKKCLMFITILKNENNYFFPKREVFFNKNFLTHSSFIRPKNKDDIGFDITKKITADGKWMKDNIKKFSIKKIYNTVTIFNLGGISNFPSKRSLQMKLNTGIIILLKEMIKFLLLKLVSKKNFYKIIYIFKYDRFNNKNFNK